MRNTLLSQRSASHAPRALLLLAAVFATATAVLLPGGAAADQDSQPASPEAGFITVGYYQSCAVVRSAGLLTGPVRCWGFGGNGQLGYGNTTSIGDDEAPDSVGPVDLGEGHTAKAISAGQVHTCAILDDGSVRCWGFGSQGRLGQGDNDDIGTKQPPSSRDTVDLGRSRTATALTAGNGHTCALLDNGTVRCWGFGNDGRLGYGNPDNIGDTETPGSVGPVPLGGPAIAISAGGFHTCALLEGGLVRCWGAGELGRLGYGNQETIGRTPETTPDKVGPVNLGEGKTAKAISAGFGHTCAILNDDTVRCWGFGGSGRLGYANRNDIGSTAATLPGSKGPIDLGPQRTAKAISAGTEHTCVILDNDTVRCWGFGAFGQLGYGDARSIGDDEHPGSVGPVDLGPGRTAIAISAGEAHTCARLDDMSVRCWGRGSNGRLGYCNEITIGDNEIPATAGPVPLGQLGIPRPQSCATAVTTPPPPPPPPTTAAPPAPVDVVQPPPPASPAPQASDRLTAALDAERARARLMSTCVRSATRRRTADRRRANLTVGARRRLAVRLATTRFTARRNVCARRYGRVPGRVTELKARRTGTGRVQLSFHVAGTDRGRAPAARNYLVKQSTRPIRTARDFANAPALCRGKCPFPELTSIHATVTLDVTSLVRNRVYYYAVAALDNVSSRVGPRSRTISIRAR